MTIQVTVRLPDDLVEFVDGQVKADRAKSRADLVARALRREQRRVEELHDAEIYAATEPDEDMDRLARWAARQPMDLD